MEFVGINRENQIYAIVGREELQSEPFDEEFYSNITRLPNELVFITISDPNKPNVDDKGYFKDKLELKFWDVEEDIGNYTPINITQAKEIYDFIITHKDAEFLINCEAGVSRSAGVGLAIEYLLRDKYIYPKWEHFPSKVLSHWRYTPNMTVFNMIISFEDTVIEKE